MDRADLIVERAVIGAFISEPNNCLDAIDTVRPAWFHNEQYRMICEVIRLLRAENRMIDLVTVFQALGGKVEALVLAECTAAISGTAHVNEHIRVLQQEYTKRELANRVGKIIAGMNDPFRAISELETELQELKLQPDFKIRPLSALQDEKLTDLDTRRRSENKIAGKRTGSPELDRKLGGYVPGDVIVVAGRPGMGKTAFAVSAGLLHCSVGGKVLMFSIEMPESQIVDRALAAQSGVFGSKIRNADLTDGDMFQLSAVKLPDTFFVNDSARITIENLTAVVRNYVTKHGITLVIVDYLQLIKSETKRNREQEIAHISGTIKRCAKEAGVTMMPLAQLSRTVEQRGNDKTPLLSDLRESGSIEQDADVVIFPFRPDYYAAEAVNKYEEDALAIIAKNRSGSTGAIPVKFQPNTARYIL